MLLRFPTLVRVMKNKNYFFHPVLWPSQCLKLESPKYKARMVSTQLCCSIPTGRMELTVMTAESWNNLSIIEMVFLTLKLAVIMFKGPITCWTSGWRMLVQLRKGVGGQAFTFLRYLESWEQTAQWSHKIKSLCLGTHFGIKCPSDQQEFPP